MAVKPHVTVDGRETPEQRRGPEPDQRCSSPSTALYLCFALSVYVISLSLVLSLTSASCFLIPLRVSRCLSNISCFFLLLSLNVFLIFPDLTRGLLPPKECPAQAKAILWLFFERDNDNPGS